MTAGSNLIGHLRSSFPPLRSYSRPSHCSYICSAVAMGTKICKHSNIYVFSSTNLWERRRVQHSEKLYLLNHTPQQHRSTVDASIDTPSISPVSTCPLPLLLLLPLLPPPTPQDQQCPPRPSSPGQSHSGRLWPSVQCHPVAWRSWRELCVCVCERGSEKGGKETTHTVWSDSQKGVWEWVWDNKNHPILCVCVCVRVQLKSTPCCGFL